MPRLYVLAVLACSALVVWGCGTVTRVSVAHRPCPPNDREFAPSPDAAARASLVPGDPTAVLVCRYWGRRDEGVRQSLAGQRLVDGKKLRSFARKLNALPPIPRDPPASCPVFGARSVLLLFRYAAAPDDPVQIVRSGCVPVSNGHIRERFGEGLSLGGGHWPDQGVL